MRLLYVSALLACSIHAQVKFTQGPDRISVEIDGKPFTDFYTSGGKPYLHPLRAASGTVVTRLFPMESGDGEVRDHPHHMGLWFAHGDVNGLDFWSIGLSRKGAKLGRISLSSIAGVTDGAKSGSVEAEFDWTDTQGRKLLTEHRVMSFHSDPVLRIVDFDLRLTAVEKAKFGDTKEGTFALRVAPWLEEPRKGAPASPPRTGRMVSADGKSGENEVWGSRSPWVDYSGVYRGEELGIAIFDHPRNPRYPTYWHSRSYGLFAANIFGLHDFLKDASDDGSMTLGPGASLRLRYRVVIHPGDAKKADIASLYKAYAATSNRPTE
jgi:hypothetical protein